MERAAVWQLRRGSPREPLPARVDGATLPRRDRNFVGGEMATPADWMFGWPEGPRAIHGSRSVVEFLSGAKGGVPMTPAQARHPAPEEFACRGSSSTLE